jgi:hypothetical protein
METSAAQFGRINLRIRLCLIGNFTQGSYKNQTKIPIVFLQSGKCSCHVYYESGSENCCRIAIGILDLKIHRF